jgi:hypothetical protein
MAHPQNANLVKLFTVDGAMFIDTHQLARPHRTLLTIYTASGKRLSDVGRTKNIRENASFGVHRDNLFASPELALADYERVQREFFAGC